MNKLKTIVLGSHPSRDAGVFFIDFGFDLVSDFGEEDSNNMPMKRKQVGQENGGIGHESESKQVAMVVDFVFVANTERFFQKNCALKSL